MNNKKVLIIEDHHDCRDLLRIVLSRSGYAVAQAGTGLEGMERAATLRPDVIVMDYGLPDVTGDKMIAGLKDNPVTQNIPVIVTTGYMNTEITQRAAAAGAASILIKPYDVDRLLVLIERCFSEITVETLVRPAKENQLDADQSRSKTFLGAELSK